MKRKKGFGIVAIILILMMGACGCTMNNSDLPSNSASEITLNERQKNILLEQGLPTNVNELTDSQQKAIVEIETMLQYAEEKYNSSFSYAGYTLASSLEKEHMRAYPSGGDKQTESFTITKTSTGYEDDYISVAATNSFSAYIGECVTSYLSGAEAKVFSEITKTSLIEIPTDYSLFDGNVESSIWIFIDGGAFNIDQMAQFKEEFSNSMKEHSLYCTAQIILLNEGRIAYLTRYNYTDYLSEEYYMSREIVYIKK